MKKRTRKPHILVITPVAHIPGVQETLESIGKVMYLDDPSATDARKHIIGKDAIYTNPNKSDVFIGPELIDAADRLQVICTASTGTTHIDKAYATQKGIAVLALTQDMSVIRKISSTAELAFGLTLATIRHIPAGFDHVKRGGWDYTQFIGRQLDHLTIGVVGYGRLGTFYAQYAKAFGGRVLVYDPYVTVRDPDLTQVKTIAPLLKKSDVIALHVHVTPETDGMVNKQWFDQMRDDVVIVNTARGEIINETDLVGFLKTHPSAQLAADVITGETTNKQTSPLIRYAKKAKNIILTPHIGGMTREGQQIAYNHAARKLKRFFSKKVL